MMVRRLLNVAALLTGSIMGFTVNGMADDDYGIKKGCWFEPPAPPSCQICADQCHPGQQCCIVIPLP